MHLAVSIWRVNFCPQLRTITLFPSVLAYDVDAKNNLISTYFDLKLKMPVSRLAVTLVNHWLLHGCSLTYTRNV